MPDSTYQWMLPLETSIQALFNGAMSTPPTFAVNATGGNTTTDMLASAASVAAMNPDHCIILFGLNDWFNHGGTPIPPSVTQSNLAAFFAAVPNCRFHVVSNMWFSSEQWPDGSGPHDATTQATNAAELAACQANPEIAEYLDIRTPIYGLYSPVLNPTDLIGGVLTQSVDDTHPSKPLGQETLSNNVFKLLTFGV